MTAEIQMRDCPGWLRNIANNHVYDKEIELPWRNLLRDSLFCPLSGFDTSPIKKYEGKIYSFVFADHEASKEQILAFIKSIPDYSVFELRAYDYYEELEPDTFKILQTNKNDGNRKEIMFYLPDPDPCVWAVLKKDDSNSKSQENRISILFFCQESCLAFNLTYKRYGVAPKFILLPADSEREYWTDLKNPGMGFMRILRETFPEFQNENIERRDEAE